MATRGAVTKRNTYSPYGEAYSATNIDGTGYTGYVMDRATGLTYMQQRYYDSQIGRFLSTEPIQANLKMGENFNRYWYGNNNPYKFTGPDGRGGYIAGQFTMPIQVDAETTSFALGFIPGFDLAVRSVKGCSTGDWAMTAIGFVPGEGKVLGAIGEKTLGVVYKRINPRTLETYICKAKSWMRCLARQGEHNRKYGVQHGFEILGKAESGKPLSHVEETKFAMQVGFKVKVGR